MVVEAEPAEDCEPGCWFGRPAALVGLKGHLIWISAARPGRTHDNTAARHDHIHARRAGPTNGPTPPRRPGTPSSTCRSPPGTTPGQKTANRVLAVGRAPVEHCFAHLKNWRTLTKLRIHWVSAGSRPL
ncbi:transposase family protein [Streptomyces sp. NBC_00268]|uniref:transposase family protein n=1 Tax=Streptomyces sp. NBC_00268 TaxID=2975695 RepID=UPI002254080E|nr:transposase family protein [Streptomyces sp. NBC_00268]MCX5181200.1 transposase family protein [Streptomyces sp. NBC_00268]